MNDRRDEQVQVKLASSEKRRIAAHANSIGMSASAFLRNLGLEEVLKHEKLNGTTEGTDDANMHCS